MLKKSQRLTTEEVKLVMEKGLFANSPLFSARYITGAEPIRLSAICSSKVGKTAVIRNRARRRVYEAVRSITGKGALKASQKSLVSPNKITTVCIICKNGAIDADFKTLKADISTLLSRIGVL